MMSSVKQFVKTKKKRLYKKIERQKKDFKNNNKKTKDHAKIKEENKQKIFHHKQKVHSIIARSLHSANFGSNADGVLKGRACYSV